MRSGTAPGCTRGPDPRCELATMVSACGASARHLVCHGRVRATHKAQRRPGPPLWMAPAGHMLTSAVRQKVSAQTAASWRPGRGGFPRSTSGPSSSTTTGGAFAWHMHGLGFCRNRGLHGSDLLAVGIHPLQARGCGHCLQGFHRQREGLHAGACLRVQLQGLPRQALPPEPPPRGGLRHRLCRHGRFNRCCHRAGCHRCGRLLGCGNSDRCRGFCGGRCKVAAAWGFVLYHLGCWRSDCVVLRCNVSGWCRRPRAEHVRRARVGRGRNGRASDVHGALRWQVRPFAL